VNCARWVLRRGWSERSDQSTQKVYHNEDLCKQNKLDDDSRLKFHQEHSGPVLADLRVWLNNQLLYQQVEQNSELGKAIVYMLKHWEGLTMFLKYPGAPIDNNFSERILKIAIRHRKASLFYKTDNGASVGDAYMSVIYTAIAFGLEPYDYIAALKNNTAQVKANPKAWLPWSYQDHKKLCANYSG